IPSTSLTLSPASRTALVIASRCSASWLLLGRMPISSLSSTPTMHAVLESSFITGLPLRPPAWTTAARTPPFASPVPPPPAAGCARRREQRQRELVVQLLVDDLHRHVTADLLRIGRDAHEIGHE